MRESKVEGTVCEYGDELGFEQRKFVSPGRKHVPDRLFMLLGVGVFFIEFKAPGKEAEPGQAREHERYLKHEVMVYVIDNIPDGKKLLTHIHTYRRLP